MNTKTILLIIILFIKNISAQNDFITTWQTTYVNETITIPTIGNGYSYDVDWDNDGVFDDLAVTENITHNYPSAGVHTITIRGDFPRIYFTTSGDKYKILSIEQWGNISWTTMFGAFRGCENLTVNATDAPDLSNVNSLAYMFLSCKSFNQPINNWDVSNVADMTSMFLGATIFNQPLANWDMSNVNSIAGMFNSASAFNQPIGNWNVSNVNTMDGAFQDAITFNQPIENWNVGNVTTMRVMFAGANAFDQPLANWDVSNVTTMRGMFGDTIAFNQPLENWDVSNVNTMMHMFLRATAFNQPLGNWNVSNVTSMSAMFVNATAFNQPLGNWNVSNVTSMFEMFAGSSLSTNNYDNSLIGWSNLALKNNVYFHGGNSNYCNGETAKNNIISNHSWNITDNGLDCSTLSISEFQSNPIEIFPNPASEFLYIKNSSSNSFIIYNANGQDALSIKTDSNFSLKRIDISHLQAGIYFLKIKEVFKKIIIN